MNKKTTIKLMFLTILFLTGFIIGSLSAFAMPDEWGRAVNNPKGDSSLTYRSINFIERFMSSIFSIFGLGASYTQGSTVTIAVFEYLSPSVKCNDAYLTVEVYNAPKDQQTSSTYQGGAYDGPYSLGLGGSLSGDFNINIPSNAKIGTWSVSSYIYCGEKGSTPADQYSSVTEKNFAVTSSCNSHASYKCYYNDIYWYNSCGNKEEMKQDCSTNGCTAGSTTCSTPPLTQDSCSDSDGDDIYTKGTTSGYYSGNSYSYPDICISSTSVKEYKCNGVYFNSYATNCPSGYSCSDGKCTTTPQVCDSHVSYKCNNNDIYWYNSCGVIEGVKQDCSTNGCTAGSTTCSTAPPPTTCTAENLILETSNDNFKINIKTAPTTVAKDSIVNVVATINNPSANGKMKIECGIYGESYLRDNNIFSLWSSKVADNCVSTEDFVDTWEVGLCAGQSKDITFTVKAEKPLETNYYVFCQPYERCHNTPEGIAQGSGVPIGSTDYQAITITGGAEVCTDTCSSLGYTSGSYYICGEMVNCGEVSPTGDYNIQIYNVNYPKQVAPGQEDIKIKFKAKNLGERGKYFVEAGIIPKSVAEDWDYKIPKTFSLFAIASEPFGYLECCEGQENIIAKTYSSWETEEVIDFELVIPKAPHQNIDDLCHKNKYWDGEGDYVLYIAGRAMAGSETGCYPEGKQAGEEVTKLININKSVSPTGDCKEPIAHEEPSIPSVPSLNKDALIDIPKWIAKYFTGVFAEKTCSISKTKKEFKESSDAEILDSICYKDDNCNSRGDYEIDCVSADTAGIGAKKDLTDYVIEQLIGVKKTTAGVCLATKEFDYFEYIMETLNVDKTTAYIIGIGVPIFGFLIFFKLLGTMVFYNGKFGGYR